MEFDSKASQSAAAKDLRRTAEERLREIKASLHQGLAAETTQRLIHELEVHQIELEMQNTELQHSRDDMERSREKLSDLFDFAPVGYLTLDNGGIITAVNIHAARLLGQVRTELIGRPFGIYVALEDRTLFSNFLGSVLTSQSDETCEVRLLLESTQKVPVLLSAMCTDSGQECLVTLVNLTEHKQHEDRLRGNEENYRFFFEYAPAALAMFDTGMRYLNVSKRWLSDYGLGNRDLIGRSHYEIFPEITDEWKSYHQRGLAGEVLRKDEDRFVRADGSVQWICWEIRPWSRLDGTISGIMIFSEDITERKRIELELQENRKQYRNLVEETPDLITRVDTEGRFVFVNHAAWKVYRIAPEECLGRLAFDTIHPDDRESTMAAFQTWLRGGNDVFTHENRLVGFDGRGHYHMAWTIRAEYDENGAITGFASTARDITDLRHAEEEKAGLLSRLHQSQKLEAIGQLAGGIAHDFNNKLMVILGSAELIRMDADDKAKILDYLQEIQLAAEHSRDITHRLLAFSRQQVVVPKTVDVNCCIVVALKSLSRLIGEHIAISFDAGSDLWSVRIDPTQLDQVIMNLAVNARDAMPGGGTITIETRNVILEGIDGIGSDSFVPGEYVRIMFSDTGTGMDQEILGRIFEPFFTTKEIGKGTGLGLATVYGIVSQNNGYIEVSSSSGSGSAFRVYLPRYFTSPNETATHCDTMYAGCGSILLVEDEAEVRKISALILKKLGYSVVEADGPRKALELVGDPSIKVDLVLTDVVMPDMNGMVLMKLIREIRPYVPCIYASGYPPNHALLGDMLSCESQFIQKPFDIIKLSNLLRDTLTKDGKRNGQDSPH